MQSLAVQEELSRVIGKPSVSRACPGETLARVELFIFLVTLLQHFCFTPAPGVSPDELHVTPSMGSNHSPVAYRLCTVSSNLGGEFSGWLWLKEL
ncbi:hypothetical protein fugu_004102 [Takifugu bimaculatus]|uniref:Uncharacterized protein n=1 Tax=Takifugu bimaculatus TaxID=433685 RepID=A0A4Z2BDV3_9TELE|nr:hypothetical protein fugu_004102 [Takifugu bimaculatus]